MHPTLFKVLSKMALKKFVDRMLIPNPHHTAVLNNTKVTAQEQRGNRADLQLCVVKY